MTNIQILASFEREIGLLDDVVNKPKTKDSEYWINLGILEFIKTRYSGNNYKTTGFEQTQKRIEDLRTLVEEYTYTPIDNGTGEYMLTLPTDYLITVGDSAYIASNDNCWPLVDGQPQELITDTLESSMDTINMERNNSLSEYHLNGNRARPLKLYIGNSIRLYTDKQYYIKSFVLTYIRKPVRFTLGTNVFLPYTELPEETHSEFIKLAARMYIENKGVPRYESYLNEINQQE